MFEGLWEQRSCGTIRGIKLVSKDLLTLTSYDNDRKFNRKDVIALRKPTYYLWRNDFSSQEEFEAERRKYVGIGFRVVTFQDGNPDTDIHEGIKALVKNHWDDIM